VFGGGVGTGLQTLNLTPDDFGGLDGCNEYLCETRPAIVQELARGHFAQGADVVVTNSFGSAQIVLAEYGLEDKTYELSRQSAALVRAVADDFSSDGWPRFVAGAVGPTTKLPSLGHITFDAMYASYMPHLLGLLDGGVDLLNIETCQDLLQMKCAIIAARDAMKQRGIFVPINCTFTVETTGTLLIGSEVAAAVATLEALPVHLIGMNCATGPDLMQENVRYLCQTSTRPVCIYPNAGLPRNVNGHAVYDLTPEQLAEYHEIFVRDYGCAMVGGCCGTTPAHTKAIYERVGSLSPRSPRGKYDSHVASTYVAVPLDQDGSTPLIVGERVNANGSKAFKELLLKEDWDAIVEMAKAEVASGAHVLDVCSAYVGRDEMRDMTEILRRFTTQITAPLMIDSTQTPVLEAGLKTVGGRAIINSINLEDGEDKFDKVAELAARYGCAIVALTIDESGMAKTAQRKLEVAQRIHDLLVTRHGIPPEAIIFDPLTFTIGSGDEDSRKAAIETLDALTLIKKHLPGVRTILGLSNISFGLKPYPRQILNSVFLSEARPRGLDAAILHQGKILPMHAITPELLEISRDLIFDRRREGYDPLFVFLEKLQGAAAPASDEGQEELPIEQRLKRAIIDGKKVGIEEKLNLALKTYPPLEIINTILLSGMKEVGELFGAGKMQLPFVLQSAETMKRAVGFLEPHMDKVGGPAKGCIVLATVKGDVHDIGKNLVDIILSNNGYKVVNLGIKQPLENILAATLEHKPTAIGMSGLLVKSTVVMKENLEEMSKRGITTPVICGGAALNRTYVEVDLKRAYTTGTVYYGADAFTGLQIMDELTGNAKELVVTTAVHETARKRGEMRHEREDRIKEKSREFVQTKTQVMKDIPTPPFWGYRHVKSNEIDLAEIFKFMNKKALFANQWQYRRGDGSTTAYRAFLNTTVEPLLAQWCQRASARGWLAPQVAYGYFPCNSDKNDLIIFDENDHQKERARISFPRQIADERRCIADYFLPLSENRRDVVGFHVVTAGEIASVKSAELFQADKFSDYLHFHGLSVETAEALAEFWHKKIRAELSIQSQDGLTIDSLFRQTYRGERYSFGYPACPNLEDQRIIFDLLKPEALGLQLTDEFQLVPEQSTSAIICHHPDACYFSI